jgi:hypothetical protein
VVLLGIAPLLLLHWRINALVLGDEQAIPWAWRQRGCAGS